MPSCIHGMDARFCSLCNRVSIGKDDSKPAFSGKPDDSPRFVKSRGKQGWQGKGKSFGTTGSLRMVEAAKQSPYSTPVEPSALNKLKFLQNLMRSTRNG